MSLIAFASHQTIVTKTRLVNMPTFAVISQFFPLVLAPGVVAMVRRQRPLKWLDGPIAVWLAVCGAAVLWAIVCGLATGEAFGPEMVRRGLLLGLVSACADTWARRGQKPAEAPPDAASDAPTLTASAPDMTPLPQTPVTHGMQLEEPWGPRPTGKG